MTTRKYSSRSQQTTLTGAITSGATSMVVVSGTSLLGGVTIPSGSTFTLVIDPDTALEEIVDATAVSTNTFTITRAIDGSTAQEHSAGAAVRHMAIGRDYRDANLHAEADASYNDGAGNAHTMHGIASGEGVVVGTLKTQTLTNKTLTSPTITNPSISGAGVDASIVFEGATADAYETTLTVVDPTQDNTVTIPNTTGTVVLDSATQTLTNKTLTSPTISGSPVITGLSSAGMVSSSATPKDYVDSILGSATAASTSAASAATSAASAATSATSAANSATASASSASASATSATAAATSATSAAASATAAATSATSAAASATAAATSATSSAASATTSSNSASAAATSATSAAASATAAATSATSASASATAAASSATAAETAWDTFDDRYLGPKSSAPTVDNDGNPLTAGVIYYNTTDGNMYVYSGSTWVVFTSSGDITSVTAGTGLSGGGSSGAVTLNLANTAVSAGSYTYTSLTVDAQGRITAASNGTTSGFALTSGKLSQFAATTSAELAGVISDETGSGALVFGTSPTIATPTLTLSSTASTAIGRVAWDNTNFQFDVGDGTTIRTITADNAAATLTNKTISGTSNTITNVSLTTGVTGTLPLANGGTGATTQAGAANAILPTQTSQSGKYLTTDGSNVSWATVSAGVTTATLEETQQQIIMGSWY